MPAKKPAAVGVDAAIEAMTIESQAIATTIDAVRDRLPAAIDLLTHVRGRVLVSGLGKSGHIGAKIAATLASTGTPAFFVHAAEALHGDSGMAAPGDVAILISYSGNTAEVAAFARMLHAQGIPIIALTSTDDSALGAIADVWLSTKVEREADPLDLAPTASTATTLAIGDALAAAAMTVKDFGADDFAIRHPGGSLGEHLGTSSMLETP